jgi:hypothetical protein
MVTTLPASLLPRLAESSLQQLVPQLTTAHEGAAALLIQVKADSSQGLADSIKKAQSVLSQSGAKFGGQPEKPLGVESYPFSTDPRVRLPQHGADQDVRHLLTVRVSNLICWSAER